MKRLNKIGFPVLLIAVATTTFRIARTSNQPQQPIAFTLMQDTYRPSRANGERVHAVSVRTSVMPDRTRIYDITMYTPIQQSYRQVVKPSGSGFAIVPAVSTVRSDIITDRNVIDATIAGIPAARCRPSHLEEEVGQEIYADRSTVIHEWNINLPSGDRLRIRRWKDPSLGCETLRCYQELISPYGEVRFAGETVTTSIIMGKVKAPRRFSVRNNSEKMTPTEASTFAMIMK
jgi:hypothetical protein